MSEYNSFFLIIQCIALREFPDSSDQALNNEWKIGQFGLILYVLIIGLAPGRHGAGRTGRPFTGDHAGASESDRGL